MSDEESIVLSYQESEESDEELLGSDLDEFSEEFVDDLVDRIMSFMEVLVGHALHSYQIPLSRRIIRSVVINDGALITGVAARQSGKDLAIDTPMLTHNRGWTTMGDLVKGDTLYAPDGTTTKVTVSHPVSMSPNGLFRVTLTDGRSLLAGGEHLWGVHDFNLRNSRKPMGEYRVLTTRELMEGGMRRSTHPGSRWRIPDQSALDTTGDNLDVDPYFLGAWLSGGEGRYSAVRIPKDIVQGVASATTYHLRPIRAEDDRSGGRVVARFWETPEKPSKSTGRKSLTAKLHLLGVARRKGEKGPSRKHIPDEYLSAGHEQRMALLRGLMDVGGVSTAANGRPRYEFRSNNQGLLEDVHTLVTSLGYFSVLMRESSRGRSRVRFFPRSGSPSPYLAKGGGIKAGTRGYRLHSYVHSIEQVPDQLTRCVTVDREDGMFLAGRGLVPTHNSEIIANTVATLMVILPRLAKIYPDLLGKFANGLWVGMFAPVEGQAETLFGRTVIRLSSERALDVLGDPEIDDITEKNPGVTKGVRLRKSGSVLMMMTANPRAKIESKSFHLIIIDECQDADDLVVSKSISPMGAYYNATMVKTGTPTTKKNNFYKSIQINKRATVAKASKRNHFEWTWREVVKVNPNYKKYIRKEMLQLGEDSDEFQLSYNCRWLLDRGMFISQSTFESLGDTSMQIMRGWTQDPVVVGIDPARRVDSTVVTVLWVNWDRPDEYGYFDHRVLNWLEIQGDDWEEQYYQIVNFLAPYDVLAVGVDSNGVGDAVAQRLKLLLPRSEVIPFNSNQAEQSKRWKHLQALIQRRLIGWPAHAKVRRLKTYQRFMQQMLDAEKKFNGQFFAVEAPNEAGAHDDYVDSLAIAAYVTAEMHIPRVEVANAPWFK